MISKNQRISKKQLEDRDFKLPSNHGSIEIWENEKTKAKVYRNPISKVVLEIEYEGDFLNTLTIPTAE